ncbi:hypothetical protein AB0F91_23010 [Amycolatopsis sp. NPDC023774]|uniref:hypothetical protein n=1 Tax=Amycolatopsis sp. NPDC023774 TaxID=3155015 RepID=UPI0033DA8E49
MANLRDRIAEASLNGWLGEVEGRTTSFTAATAKLADLDRTRKRDFNSVYKQSDKCGQEYRAGRRRL